jgi:D-alanine transaminase
VENLGYYNGKFGPLEEMTVPMNDRAGYFGDGIYDASTAYNHVIYQLDEHLDRFYNNAALVRIKAPMSKSELKAELVRMVEKVDSREQFVYWQLSRGAAIRDHKFPEGVDGNIWIMLKPHKMESIYRKIRLITLEDTRFFHCNIKTLNLLPAVMASQKAAEAGVHETVLHRGDRVTECAHSNVSILKDGIFKTAPADNLILPGVARAHLIKACKENNIPVDESPYTLKDLFAADEVIVSSSSTFGLAATHIDGKAVGGKAPELLKIIQDAVMREFWEYTKL